jgi:NAD kinase
MKSIKNILVIAKTSKLKYLYGKYGDVTTQNCQEFKMLGESMELHKINVDKFIDQLMIIKPSHVKVEVVEDNFLENKCISSMIEKHHNLIFSLGGDGTFLRTSQFVDDNETILIGVNTDPINSRGFYCSMNTGLSLSTSMKKLFKDECKIKKLNKITVKTKNNSYHFINDCYFGEKFMGRISKYALQIDQGTEEIIKSSGIILSTCI